MKKIYNLLSAILLTTIGFAQSPDLMSYQAVVRDGSNNLVALSPVGMQISILQGSTNGTAVYTETHTSTSNANGLVTVQIGDGTTGDDFSTIDWANGPYFVKTETDPTGGTNYTVTATSQLLSVPFALHAKNTDSWTVIGDTTYTNKTVSIGSSLPRGKLYVLDNAPGPDIAMEAQGDFNPLISFRRTNSTSFIDYLWFWGMTGNGSIRLRDDFSGEDRILTDTNGKTTINDVMNLTPRTTAPATPSKGDMYMDDTTNKLMVYDGTTWQACW